MVAKKNRDEVILGYFNKLNDIKNKEKQFDITNKLLNRAKEDQDMPLISFCEGYKFYLMKEYNKAIACFKEAIRRTTDGKFYFAWNSLGRALIEFDEMEKYYEGKKAFEKAKQINSTYYFAYDGLGTCFMKMGEYEKAIAAYSNSTRIFRENSSSWNGLGMSHYYMHEYSEAKDAFKNATELDPNYAYAFRNLAILYYEGMNDKDNALENFLVAHKLYMDQGEIRLASMMESYIQEVDLSIKIDKEIKLHLDVKQFDPLVKLLYETLSFEKEIEIEKRTFLDFIEKRRDMESMGELSLTVLRRWNSYTPIVANKYHSSKGGGYYINFFGKGIVIDPGFNFIENFISAGHIFDEIDYVLITHAHNDHTADFESILTLLYRCNQSRKGLDYFHNQNTIRNDLAKSNNKKLNDITEEEIEKAFLKSKRRKNIQFFFSESVKRKFIGFIDNSNNTEWSYESIKVGDRIIISKDGYFLQNNNETPNTADDKLIILILPAYHNDIFSKDNSVGFLFDLKDTLFLYTGDTGWEEIIEDNYKIIYRNRGEKKLVLLCHLGGFEKKEKKYIFQTNSKESFYKQHLGRLGIGKLIQTLHPNICFISEFGEELKNYRKRICQAFHDTFPHTIFIPADIGLEYDFLRGKVKAISEINCKKMRYGEKDTEPSLITSCLLRKDYSLHYYNKNGGFEESDLIQALRDEYDQSTK